MTIFRHVLLAVIIATVVAWVVTQRYLLLIYPGKYSCLMGRGGMSFSFVDVITVGPQQQLIGSSLWYMKADEYRWFAHLEVNSVFATIPFWLILVILLPPWWLMGRTSRQRKRWEKEGCCLSCGYNLQGSESGTCSECGTGHGKSKLAKKVV